MAVDITPISWWKMFSSPAPSSTTFTLCCWVRTDRLPGVSDENTIWWMDNFSAANPAHLVFVNASGSPRLEAWQNGSSRVVGPTVSTGEWVFGAYVCTGGTDLDLYWRLEGEGSLSTDGGTTDSTPALSEMLMGADRGFLNAQCLSGAVAFMRYWDGAALSGAELLDESASATAVRTSNLFADWPFENTTNDTTDISGENHGLEWNVDTGGSQADAADPDIDIDAGITGTAAPTQAADTSAATGQLGYTGTSAATQAAQTSAATGQLGYSGSSTAQQADQTSTATGQLGYSGTAATTQAAQTSSASGAVGDVFEGTVAATQDAQIGSGSGQLGSTGTATPTQAAQTAAAAGQLGYAGTSATSQANQTSTASGQLGTTGTAAPSQANQTATAAGFIHITGTVAVTQAANTASATGTLPGLQVAGDPTAWTEAGYGATHTESGYHSTHLEAV